MTNAADNKWTGRTDGFLWMHHALIWMLKYVDIRFFYAVVDIVILFYMLLAHHYYLAIFHYFKQQHRKNTINALLHTYLTFRQFGLVVIDRFATYAGQQFQFDMRGENLTHISDNNKGLILLASHMGNFEMAGYFLNPVQQMYVLMYEGEKKTIIENKLKRFRQHNIHPVFHQADWSHLYTINDILSKGNILTLFSDRTLGSPKTLPCEIMGNKARLPLGPFTVTQLHPDTPIAVIFVMKESKNRYSVHIKQITAQTKEECATAFANELTHMIQQYPHQWYNFYEFWQ